MKKPRNGEVPPIQNYTYIFILFQLYYQLIFSIWLMIEYSTCKNSLLTSSPSCTLVSKQIFDGALKHYRHIFKKRSKPTKNQHCTATGIKKTWKRAKKLFGRQQFCVYVFFLKRNWGHSVPLSLKTDVVNVFHFVLRLYRLSLWVRLKYTAFGCNSSQYRSDSQESPTRYGDTTQMDIVFFLP